MVFLWGRREGIDSEEGCGGFVEQGKDPSNLMLKQAVTKAASGVWFFSIRPLLAGV